MWETGGILLREYCFRRENSLSSARWVLQRTRWVSSVGTLLLGWEELTVFSPWSSVRAKKSGECKALIFLRLWSSYARMLCTFCPPTILGEAYRIPQKMQRACESKRIRASKGLELYILLTENSLRSVFETVLSEPVFSPFQIITSRDAKECLFYVFFLPPWYCQRLPAFWMQISANLG